MELVGINVNGRRLGTRRDIGASGGGDTVLDVGTGDRVRVEGLDVEYNGDDVEVEPEAGAQVRSLAS